MAMAKKPSFYSQLLIYPEHSNQAQFPETSQQVLQRRPVESLLNAKT
jgi:hypothetical protein